MTNKELNDQALKELENIHQNGYLEDLEIIEQQMRDCKNKADIEFYMGVQDRLNYIYGEISNSYSELNAELEKYIADRKFQISIEYSNNKQFTINDKEVKLTATMISAVRISSLIKSEISDLYKVVLLLEGKLNRVRGSLQTARNHSYVTKEIEKER